MALSHCLCKPITLMESSKWQREDGGRLFDPIADTYRNVCVGGIYANATVTPHSGNSHRRLINRGACTTPMALFLTCPPIEKDGARQRDFPMRHVDLCAQPLLAFLCKRAFRDPAAPVLPCKGNGACSWLLGFLAGKIKGCSYGQF